MLEMLTSLNNYVYLLLDWSVNKSVNKQEKWIFYLFLTFFLEYILKSRKICHSIRVRNKVMMSTDFSYGLKSTHIIGRGALPHS